QTGIRGPHEPQVIQLLLPICRSGTSRNPQRREGLPVELADPPIRGEVDVARLVFLNAPNLIADQPVFRREVYDGSPHVAVHTSIIAYEPVVIILVLKNVHHALAKLWNVLAYVNRSLLVVRGAVGLLLGHRVLVLRGSTGGHRGEGNRDDGVEG